MSLFTMDDVNKVIKLSLVEAKAFAMEVIRKDEKAKPVTRVKAIQVVSKARTPKDLAFSMSSWILAHPTEGLKVVKVLA